MVTILFTKANGLIVKSCFIESSMNFQIILEYPNGSEIVIETIKNITALVETHDKWVKFFLNAKIA